VSEFEAWHNNKSALNQPRHVNIYSASLLISVLLFVALCFIFISSAMREQERDFDAFANNSFQFLEGMVQTNESVLEGLAAYQAVSGWDDAPSFRPYTQRLLDRYSHIYMVQVALGLPSDRVQSFEEFYRDWGAEGFKIKRFDYSSKDFWQSVGGSTFVAPLVYMEPVPSVPGINILGMDLLSMPFLRDALIEAKKTESFALTNPFELYEGDLGYAMVKTMPFRYPEGADGLRSGGNDLWGYTLLIIRTQEMLPANIPSDRGFMITLYNTRYLENDPEGYLVSINNGERSALETLLFPQYYFEREVGGEGHRLNLVIRHQLGWNSFSFLWLLGITLLSTGLAGMILWARKSHIQREIARIAADDKLHFLANYDKLTGLPNRNYLADFMRHAFIGSKRRGSQLAVLYLDLDGFKPINDTLGHQSGDEVLVLVASAMRNQLREEDILARVGGDEFVVVLEDVQSRADCQRVVSEIKKAVASIHWVCGQEVKVGVSIGMAMYPEDGDSVEELIRKADTAMYSDKQKGKRPGLRIVR